MLGSFPTVTDSADNPNMERSRSNNRRLANADASLATICISYVANHGACPEKTLKNSENSVGGV